MTALVRDIQRQHPGQFEISVDTNWTPVWWHNPHIVKLNNAVKPSPQRVTVAWGEAITHHSRAKIGIRRELRHILAWYHYDFTRQTGIPVAVTEPRPELFLSESEQQPILDGRYWVLIGGGKLDITNKLWSPESYQQVVNELRKAGLRFVQCGATHQANMHPPLENVLNMVGKTDNVRDLFNIIRHADGVICPVTSAMHIAAAFEKPCVVIAGGREEPWFEWYGNGFEAFGPGSAAVQVPHKFLHTVGLIHCCDKEGCWRRRTVPLDANDVTGKGVKELCHEPVRLGEGQAIASCMHMITPEHVIEAVMEYYDSKILPPIGPPKAPIALDGTYSAHLPADMPFSSQVIPVPPKPVLVEPLSPPQAVEPAGITLVRLPTTEIQEPHTLRPPSLPARSQKAVQKTYPAEYNVVTTAHRELDVLDHPIIGGKVTICVLCYGPHTELAKRCLSSILNTVPRERIDLRIATNEAASATVDYLRGLGADHLYINAANRKKYPVMREMFWDPTAPLRTNYLVWFDDDAQVIDPRWMLRLAETIISNHRAGCRLYGAKMYHDLNVYAKRGARPELWFRQAPWHRGVNFRVRGSERAAPNGSCIDFVVGWCWAIGTDAIKAGNIPDTRLNHNGGDITIGAQVLQTGFKLREFNKAKALVWCPSKEQGGRRGFEEKFPWAP